MSGLPECACSPRNVEVMHYKHNHSRFNPGGYAESPFSEVKCLTCGHYWRTKAKWVDALMDRICAFDR